MSQHHLQTWAYDDFERYLLDSARGDSAPEDLPARVGVALGLAVPVLMVTEAGAAAGTTATALWSTGGVKTVGVAVAATAKGTATIAATALWSTAVKGIAVGLLAGAAAISAGSAAVALYEGKPATIELPGVQSPENARNASRRNLNATLRSRTPESVALHPTSEDPGAAGPEVSRNVEAQSFVSGSVAASLRQKPTVRALETATTMDLPAVGRTASESDKAAVARFEVVTDENAAPSSPASSQPSTEPEEALSSEQYRRLRAKTITRVRSLLGRNQSDPALTMLGQFHSRVGAARFGVEELLLKIEALVNLGRLKEARAEADLVERIAPNSVSLRRARLLAGSRVVR